MDSKFKLHNQVLTVNKLFLTQGQVYFYFKKERLQIVSINRQIYTPSLGSQVTKGGYPVTTVDV